MLLFVVDLEQPSEKQPCWSIHVLQPGHRYVEVHNNHAYTRPLRYIERSVFMVGCLETISFGLQQFWALVMIVMVIPQRLQLHNDIDYNIVIAP